MGHFKYEKCSNAWLVRDVCEVLGHHDHNSIFKESIGATTGRSENLLANKMPHFVINLLYVMCSKLNDVVHLMHGMSMHGHG